MLQIMIRKLAKGHSILLRYILSFLKSRIRTPLLKTTKDAYYKTMQATTPNSRGAYLGWVKRIGFWDFYFKMISATLKRIKMVKRDNSYV